MRILCVGDIHAMDKAPASIHPGYQEEIYSILEFCSTLEYDHAVWAGDVFNFKAPSKNSHALVRGMLETAQRFRDLSVIVGNHDLSHDHLGSLPSQPLGVLFQGGVRDLRGWHDSAPVYGVPWQDWEGDWDEAFAEWRSRPEDYRASALLVTHCPLFPPDIEENVPYERVPTVEIANAMGNVGSIYYGHIHEDHGVFTSAGVQFANMGAISRGSLHEYNVERQVKVCIFDTDTATFTEVPVPVRPASEHFRIEEKTAEKANSKDLEAFLEDIGSQTLDMSHTESVIHHIESLDTVDSRIREAAAQVLRDVM